MTLPASQYSVLDAKKIERIDEDSFRCYVGGLHFLNIVVEPVLTVSVVVEERGPVVKLLSTKVGASLHSLSPDAHMHALPCIRISGMRDLSTSLNNSLSAQLFFFDIWKHNKFPFLDVWRGQRDLLGNLS